MALKSTPEKKNTRNNSDTRRLSFSEEPSPSRPLVKKKVKHRDASTIAVVNPRMVPQISNCCQSYQQYRPVYSYGYPPPISVVRAMTSYGAPIARGYPYANPRWNTVVARAPPPIPRPTQIYSVPIPALPVAAMTLPIYSPIHPPVYSYGAMLTPPVVTEPLMLSPHPPVCLYGAMPTPPVVKEPTMLSSHPPVCPYGALLTPPVVTEPPMLSPVAATIAPFERFFNFESAYYEQKKHAPAVSASTSYENILEELEQKLKNSPVLSPGQCRRLKPEEYFQLPKHLFLPARLMGMDPNPLIDQFCRVSDCVNHSPWILDLEFGVPRIPVTRPIATYDVQFNSIHCKNTPGAIHPGFESCNREFKKQFLLHYDSIVSIWYKGYILMNCDRSVANFQSWLQVPMQTFGMCWP